MLMWLTWLASEAICRKEGCEELDPEPWIPATFLKGRGVQAFFLAVYACVYLLLAQNSTIFACTGACTLERLLVGPHLTLTWVFFDLDLCWQYHREKRGWKIGTA